MRQVSKHNILLAPEPRRTPKTIRRPSKGKSAPQGDDDEFGDDRTALDELETDHETTCIGDDDLETDADLERDETGEPRTVRKHASAEDVASDDIQALCSMVRGIEQRINEAQLMTPSVAPTRLASSRTDSTTPKPVWRPTSRRPHTAGGTPTRRRTPSSKSKSKAARDPAGDARDEPPHERGAAAAAAAAQREAALVEELSSERAQREALARQVATLQETVDMLAQRLDTQQCFLEQFNLAAARPAPAPALSPGEMPRAAAPELGEYSASSRGAVTATAAFSPEEPVPVTEVGDVYGDAYADYGLVEHVTPPSVLDVSRRLPFGATTPLDDARVLDDARLGDDDKAGSLASAAKSLLASLPPKAHRCFMTTVHTPTAVVEDDSAALYDTPPPPPLPADHSPPIGQWMPPAPR